MFVVFYACKSIASKRNYVIDKLYSALMILAGKYTEIKGKCREKNDTKGQCYTGQTMTSENRHENI